MNDYGRGGILGATTLPATSALALYLSEKTNSALILGLIALTVIGLVLQIAAISRFAANRKDNTK